MANIKAIGGLAIASVKSVNALAKASVKAMGELLAAASFTANTAVFDGTNDWASKTGVPSGISADGKLSTFSCWLKLTNKDKLQYIYVLGINGSTSNRYSFWITSGNLIQIVGRNSANNIQLNVTGQTALTTGQWYHIYACFNMANTALRKIYIDGAAEILTVTTYNNADIDFNGGDRMRIGADTQTTPANKLDAALAELWFDVSYLDDPTKFAAAGKPISLGTTGELPTGTAPVCYHSLNGSGDSWATDSSGRGNTLTVTGALGTTTAP